MIKVENPGNGDHARGWGPPYWHGTSCAFQSLNRDKRGITVDLRDPGAAAAAAQLSLASPRISGLMFGAEDFSRDIGLPTVRTGRAREFIHARSMIVFAAAAAGVTPIDGVWPNLADDEGLRQDSLLARDLGFAGKSLIHPGQISTINEVFSPTAEDLDFARRLIADFETAVENGRGSISFAGQLVDRPIYERARATVRLGDR